MRILGSFLRVDGDSRIVAGHGRLAAASHLKLSSVPTISLAHLSPAQAKAFLLADNKLTENAEWDDLLLADQFKFLAEADLDFSLEVTGFEMGEIDVCLEAATSVDASATEDVLDPGTLVGPSICRVGDLWQLGRHRLLCASSLESTSFVTLMDGKLAAMVFTDPPYNVPIDGYATGFGKIHHQEFSMAAGEMSPAEFTTFLAIALNLGRL